MPTTIGGLPGGQSITFPDGMSTSQMEAGVMATFPELKPTLTDQVVAGAKNKYSQLSDAVSDLFASKPTGPSGGVFDTLPYVAPTGPSTAGQTTPDIDDTNPMGSVDPAFTAKTIDTLRHMPVPAVRALADGNGIVAHIARGIVANGLNQTSGTYEPNETVDGVTYGDQVNTPPEATAGNVVKSLGNAWVAALARTALSLKEVYANAQRNSLPDDANVAHYTAMIKDAQDTRRLIDGAEAANTPEMDTKAGQFMLDTAHSGLSMAPSLLAGGVTGKAAVGASSMALQAFGDAYGKYSTRGATPSEALLGAGLESTVMGVAATVPLGFFAKNFGKMETSNFVEGLVSHGVPTMVAQGMATSLVDTMVANPNETIQGWAEKQPGLATRSAMAAFLFAGVAGAAHVGTTAVKGGYTRGGRFANALDADVANTQFVSPSDTQVASMLNHSTMDPNAIRPEDTVKPVAAPDAAVVNAPDVDTAIAAAKDAVNKPLPAPVGGTADIDAVRATLNAIRPEPILRADTEANEPIGVAPAESTPIGNDSTPIGGDSAPIESFENEGGRYASRQQARAAGMAPEEIDKIGAAKFGPGWQNLKDTGLLKVVPTMDDMPAEATQGMTGSEDGVYHNGTAYLIGANMSPARVIRTTIHEIGEHAGLQTFMGNDGYDRLIHRVRDLNDSGSPQVAAIWSDVKKLYDLPEGSTPFVKEVIAKLGETAEGRSTDLWTRITTPVKMWLDKMGLRNFNEHDIADLVTASLRKQMSTPGVGPTPVGFTPQEDQARGNAPPVSFLRIPSEGMPENAMPANAAFSLTENNASGESSASLEAISRSAREKDNNQGRYLIDKYGNVTPLIGVDAVDTYARSGQVIAQRGVGVSKWTVLSKGADVREGDVNRALYNLEQKVPMASRRNPEELERNEPLHGMPTKVEVNGKQETFGPFEKARDAARRYMVEAGLPYDPPHDYVKVDPARAKRIADAYEAMPHNPNDPAVKASYDALIKETLKQWDAIKASGLKVNFISGKDPYGNPRNAIKDVVENNHLWVYPTDAGFGGSESAHVDTSGNPLLKIAPGEMIDGKPVRINDIFRIVHDYFGHVKEGVGFRADGEENAWQSHAAMYSDLARKAMTTETRGQNSWVNYGPFAERNKSASPADTEYAPQKAGLLPDWASEESRLSQKPTVNIGLNVNDGSKIAPAKAISELQKAGVDVQHSEVRASNTEPTLIAKLSRALTPDEAHTVSVNLKQDAIAQMSKGKGELYGPKADDWRPFNQDYFLHPTEEPTKPMASRRDPNEAEAPEPVGILAKIKASNAVDSVRDFSTKLVNDIQLNTMPMSANSASPEARATAKDTANKLRLSQYQWSKFDDVLVKNYTPEQREAMWRAGDEQNVLMQRGENTGGKGVDALPPDQKATVEALHNYGEDLLQQAKDVGMFKGEGLPYWTPRMAVMINGEGEYSRPPSGAKGVSSDGRGANITTSSPNLKQRKYLTSEETEAAMKSKLGENAQMVPDIRTMPLAMARLERAIAGRELINKIKELGKTSGTETVSSSEQPGFFTLDHPAFKTYAPRFIDDGTGKMIAAHDENGSMLFDKVPIYVSKQFEGPLKAIMSDKPGMVYSGLMSLKGKTTGVILYSPLIHNLVEYGRALPVMGLKPMLTLGFSTYYHGNAVKNDPVQMREAISHGLVPIGNRGGVQDITGVMETPSMVAGRSWTAKLLAAPVGLVSKEGALRTKQLVDAAGNFWHNTLLWDRVADLQMGLYKIVLDATEKKLTGTGLSPAEARGTALYVAAHMANRYAGALPNEAMSNMSRKVANLTLFSRTFTLGNIGVMKDMVTGLPTEVKAQIARDYGELAARAGTSVARRKAIGAFTRDVALMYAGNAILQMVLDHWKRDKSWNEIEQGWVDRFHALAHKIDSNPLSVLNSPLSSAESLLPNSQNEPGKENRALWDYDKTGTAIYARVPTGKIGEEFIGWATSPREKLLAKSSTFLRPMLQTFTGGPGGDKGFGQRVYNPDDPGVAGAVRNVGKIVGNFMKQQVPWDSAKALLSIAKGQADETDKYKVLGPLLGVTFSKGAPGGPAVGEMYTEERKQRAAVADIMPDVHDLLRHGNDTEARALMRDNGMTSREIMNVVKYANSPQMRLNARAVQQFNRHATDEEKDKFNSLRNP